MNVDYCTLIWAGGTHRFRLASPPPPAAPPSDLEQVRRQVRALRAGVGAPAYLHDRVGAVLNRLLSRSMGMDDVCEPIRCGLIGGGDLGAGEEAWARAAELIEDHVRGKPLAASLPIAQTICMAAVVGIAPELADRPLRPTALDQDPTAG